MPSLNVLFWNVGKKNLTTQLVNLARDKDVDILVLVENVVSSEQLVRALNHQLTGYHSNHPISQCDKVTIITRFPHAFIPPVYETNRLTVRKMQVPMYPPFLLTALHLIDKGNASVESQTSEAYVTVRELIGEEKKHLLDAMIVVGDFNMNPFDAGMVSAAGFHGTMSSELAIEGSRKIQERDYAYFYNPTWGLFGDLIKEASGTYYYRNAEQVCLQWNMFDQVLIRPGLIPNFVKESLTIIQQDGVTSLLTQKNRPNQSLYSDHLPLFFTLKF
ncbi:endonuclease/exonuclease/phosphatase family protein [uncultured Fibrella sp.]|uniref:endonuclease/exonuclease/phosphatase family protein n=1 Tax=uncultured Fibrella sp. TaxID=1284596 RepID=UPI0035CBEC2A